MKLPLSPSFKLVGKRTLVTGASSGIGVACASALAEAGAQVHLVARREDRLREIVDALRERGDSASFTVLDITDTAALNDFVARVEPFDVLVNSAGLARHAAAFETQESDFDAVIALNLKAAYFLTVAVARRAADAARCASLINISSQMGHVGGIDRSVYCASKFAVEGFTKAMAMEWGKKGIRVNTVCPTFIRTELTEATFANPARREWIENKIKLGRVGEVEDLMGAIVYLASDASSLVTGSSMLVDGGWTVG
ncbi:MAG: SDR family oxidoreductase [Oceanospirillaceae bacterium]|nr:SDR family oxidoreductase [Oceanospirillaceae bacterium]